MTAALGLVVLLISACGAEVAEVAEADTATTNGGVLSEGDGTIDDGILPMDPLQDSTVLAEQTIADAETAAEAASAQLNGGTLGGVALSPTGQYLAAAKENGLFLYRADTLEQLWFSASDTPLRCLTWSPDGRYLFTGGGNASSSVWQASDGTRLQVLATPARGNSCPAAWSPDGQRVADGRVMWNISTWQVEKEFWGVGMSGRWGIYAIAWSPDGQKVAFAYYAGDIHIVDVAGMQTIIRLKCSSCTTIIRSLSWSPDGQRLAAGFDLPAVTVVWDVQSGAVIKKLDRKGARVAWSPDGTMLAAISKSPNKVVLLTTANWRLNRTWDVPFESIQLSWSPDGRSLVTAGAGGSIVLWPLDKTAPPVAAPPIVCKNGASKVYLVVGKERRHVKDWDTFLNLGYKQGQIIPCGAMRSYPEGGPITRVLKGAGDPVYWMENGLRRHIPDMETFNSLGFQVKDISTVPDSVLNLWPPGEPLPSAKTSQ